MNNTQKERAIGLLERASAEFELHPEDRRSEGKIGFEIDAFLMEVRGSIKLEEGRYYRSREGKKIGPMVVSDLLGFDFQCADGYYNSHGLAVADHLDAIEEWTN